MNRYIVKHKETMGINKSPERIGGKASQLFKINPDLLPYWSVITADCPDDKLEEVCHEIWQQVGGYSLWPHGKPPWLSLYAVRSSAVGEDGKDQSYAGIFESKLNVPITGIEHAVREVRDSANAARAKVYYQAAMSGETFPPAPSPNVAVIVMPMVKARYSGVLFSKEPVEGTDRMLVEWEVGAGGVVDGESNSNMLFLHSEKFYRSDDTDPLDDAAMHAIWQEAKRLEKNYGRPVDIEWAITEEGKPFVLQVRPITAGVTA